jgi:putative membrane protein
MLKNLVVSWVVMAAAFAVTAWLLNGMEVSGGFFSYLWIAAVFGVVNAIVGTILRILTFPLIILTFGLFAVIVNALLLSLTDAITSDLTIDDFFWTTIWAALILAFVSVIIGAIAGSILKTDSPKTA